MTICPKMPKLASQLCALLLGDCLLQFRNFHRFKQHSLRQGRRTDATVFPGSGRLRVRGHRAGKALAEMLRVSIPGAFFPLATLVYGLDVDERTRHFVKQVFWIVPFWR